MLIILGGLPATGKSTIAKSLARRIGACYLRVDTIEQAIRATAPLRDGEDVGPAGYVALYRLAADNLQLGRTVIADTVNPVEATRQAFRRVAAEAGSPFVEVEVFCSDAATHRHRAETRPAEVEGLIWPSWREIQDRHFDPWAPTVRLDTFRLSVDDSVAEIVKRL